MQTSASSTVGLFEAKTHFSAIVERVHETGVPVRVTRRGKPIVDISPVKPDGPPKMTREEMFAIVEEMRGTTPRMTEQEIHDCIAEGRR